MIDDEDIHDFLEHFGVKGQRWGVRKDRKAASENFMKVAGEVNKRQQEKRYNSAISEEKYKTLNTKPIVIKKGTELKRITTDPFENRDALYVSIHPKDAEYYRAVMPTASSGGLPAKSYKGYYEKSMKALEDLKSPSEKERVDAYIKLMDNPAIKTLDGQVITGREYMRQQGLGSVVNSLSSKQLALTYYGQLIATQGIKNDPINTALFKQLSEKGYNALVDDNDLGVMARQPLLALNATKSIKTENIKQLTDQEIRDAQKRMSPP